MTADDMAGMIARAVQQQVAAQMKILTAKNPQFSTPQPSKKNFLKVCEDCALAHAASPGKKGVNDKIYAGKTRPPTGGDFLTVNATIPCKVCQHEIISDVQATLRELLDVATGEKSTGFEGLQLASIPCIELAAH